MRDLSCTRISYLNSIIFFFPLQCVHSPFHYSDILVSQSSQGMCISKEMVQDTHNSYFTWTWVRNTKKKAKDCVTIITTLNLEIFALMLFDIPGLSQYFI